MTRKKKPTASLVRSSAVEYLTFVAASGSGGVEAVCADENVRFSQKMMAQLNDVEIPTINYHLKKVFEDSELEEGAVLRNFRITAPNDKTYDTKHYNLSAIIAVGYKVNSERAVSGSKTESSCDPLLPVGGGNRSCRSPWRSRAVMVRIGMNHDARDDFDHAKLAWSHPLRRHVLNRLSRRP